MIVSVMKRLRSRFLGRMDLDYYRRLGMKVGADVQLGPNCRFDPSTAWMIEIGDDVVFAPGVQILAHDASLRRRIGFTKIAFTTLGSRIFVGSNVVILPGVNIGDDTIIGAGSVVTRDIPSNSVAYGNPARVRQSTDEFELRQLAELRTGFVYTDRAPGAVLTAREQLLLKAGVRRSGKGWIE